MTHPEQTTLLAEFYAEKKNVLKLKGEDYANEDVLSNFKSAGANIGISPEVQCLSLIATKVARLGNLLSGKKPNNESIADSILDLSNYTDLLYCLVNEKTNHRKHLVEIMQADEKDGLYEIGTKRWENVKPVEDFQIKVGDKLKDDKGMILLVKGKNLDSNMVLLQFNTLNISNWYYLSSVEKDIKSGWLKKIN